MSLPVQAVVPLPPSTEMGRLGVVHLRRYWSRFQALRNGRAVPPADPTEVQYDHLVLDALGLGLGQTSAYLLGEGPDFATFERWIEDTTGGVEPARVARFNALVRGEPPADAVQAQWAAVSAAEPVLTATDLAHWEEYGFVVLRQAVDESTRAEAERLVWQTVGGNPADADSWYGARGHGITLEVYQAAVLTAIRRAPRIVKAFAQLWGTADLWATTDRLGFYPPIRPGYAGSVQKLHWDVSLARPVPFGTQGMLYLTDNPAEQGAFQLVPGFHRRLDAWLDELPAGAVPGQQDLVALGPERIPGRAGDLIIWNHLLPHGPSQNHGERPRIVFYLNLYASAYRAQADWL